MATEVARGVPVEDWLQEMRRELAPRCGCTASHAGTGICDASGAAGVVVDGALVLMCTACAAVSDPAR